MFPAIKSERNEINNFLSIVFKISPKVFKILVMRLYLRKKVNKTLLLPPNYQPFELFEPFEPLEPFQLIEPESY